MISVHLLLTTSCFINKIWFIRQEFLNFQDIKQIYLSYLSFFFIRLIPLINFSRKMSLPVITSLSYTQPLNLQVFPGFFCCVYDCCCCCLKPFFFYKRKHVPSKSYPYKLSLFLSSPLPVSSSLESNFSKKLSILTFPYFLSFCHTKRWPPVNHPTERALLNGTIGCHVTKITKEFSILILLDLLVALGVDIHSSTLSFLETDFPLVFVSQHYPVFPSTLLGTIFSIS